MAVRKPGLAPGLIFFSPNNGLAPDGLLIMDDAGRPVSIRPGTKGNHTTNLAVASYLGQPVLTWWEGTVENGGNGSGELVAVDSSYREILRVGAGAGHPADLHELLITPAGTLLAFSGSAMTFDAPAGATPFPWQIWDDVILETDLASGAVLFEWHTRDHIDVDEAITPPPTSGKVAYDDVHLNSIEVDSDGNLLVSARNTSAVYKIDRQTGVILWRLGGKRSDFTFGDGAAFSWQHDARRQPDGNLRIFDDGTAPAHSREIVIRLDEARKTVTLVRAYDHPRGLRAESQGSGRLLPNGNMFVGWGSTPYLSEFGPDGTLLLDVSFPDAVQSYRSIRAPWVGRPATRPDLVVETSPDGSQVAYASWNGATEVASWGDCSRAMRMPASTPAGRSWADFETTLAISGSSRYVAARALDASGRTLATLVAVRSGA